MADQLLPSDPYHQPSDTYHQLKLNQEVQMVETTGISCICTMLESQDVFLEIVCATASVGYNGLRGLA